MKDSGNCEAIDELVAFFTGGGGQGVIALLDEDAVANHWRWGAKEIRGKQALIDQYFGPLRTAFPDIDFKVFDLIRGEDKIAVRGEFNATFENEWVGIKPHGRRVKWRAHDIFEFRNGKIARIWLGNDTLTVARQIGALPDNGFPW